MKTNTVATSHWPRLSPGFSAARLSPQRQPLSGRSGATASSSALAGVLVAEKTDLPKTPARAERLQRPGKGACGSAQGGSLPAAAELNTPKDGRVPRRCGYDTSRTPAANGRDVRRPLTSNFEMQGRPETESLSIDSESYMAPNARLSSFERLEIYSRQYWFRLISAAAEDFPTLNAVLGQKRFDALILADLGETFDIMDLTKLGARA